MLLGIMNVNIEEIPGLGPKHYGKHLVSLAKLKVKRK